MDKNLTRKKKRIVVPCASLKNNWQKSMKNWPDFAKKEKYFMQFFFNKVKVQ